MPLLIGAAVAGIGGLAATAYGASQAGKVTKYDQNKIRKDLAPWQKDIDTMRGQAQTTWDQSQQFFDPRSDYYNQQRQQMREQIAGQTANVVQQQNQLMAQRGMGGGGIKGLLGAVSANQAGEQTRQGMIGMQQQGLGSLFTLGGAQQAQQQQVENELFRRAVEQQQEPYKRMGFFSDVMQGIPSYQQTMQQKTGAYTNPLLGAIGAGLGT